MLETYLAIVAGAALATFAAMDWKEARDFTLVNIALLAFVVGLQHLQLGGGILWGLPTIFAAYVAGKYGQQFLPKLPSIARALAHDTRLLAWKNRRALALMFVVALAAPVGAQIAGHGNSNQDCKPPETFIGLLGVTSAGNTEVCLAYPQFVPDASSSFTAGITLTAPPATGAGAATFTVTWSAVNGCTVGTQTNGGAGGSGFTSQFYSRNTFTLTAQACSGRAVFDYKNGAGTSLDTDAFDFTVMAYNTYQRVENHLCSGTLATCNIAQVATCNASDAAATNTCKDPDVRQFICAASTADPLVPGSCVNPTVNNAVTGTLTVTNTGGQAIALTGTLDTLARLCNDSTFGAACAQPDLNVHLCSATQTGCNGAVLNVTGSLDAQTRFCAASAIGAACTTPTVNTPITGTLTVTNAGGQTVTVSGALDTLARLCAASAVGSACGVATINTPISGALTVHQDALSGAITVTNAGGQSLTVSECQKVTPCYVVNSGMSNTTFTGNISIPSAVQVGVRSTDLPTYLPMIMAVIFTVAGEVRSDANPKRGKIYKATAGCLWFFVAIFTPMPTMVRLFVLGVGVYQILYWYFSNEKE